MSLLRFLGLSILLHLLLLFGFIGVQAISPNAPLMGGAEIRVELASAGTESASEGERKQPGHPSRSGPAFAGTGGMTGDHPGVGSGAPGTDPLLAKILARIEAAKRYPHLALRSGSRGRVHIRFLLNPQGDPVELKILQSSGVAILDQESLATVRRAAPYPLYPKPLSVWLSFEGGKT